MAMDPQAQAIVQQLGDALQVAMLLTARLERDLQELSNQATQLREPLSKVVAAVRELQCIEHTKPHRESANGSDADSGDGDPEDRAGTVAIEADRRED